MISPKTPGMRMAMGTIKHPSDLRLGARSLPCALPLDAAPGRVPRVRGFTRLGEREPVAPPISFSVTALVIRTFLQKIVRLCHDAIFHPDKLW